MKNSNLVLYAIIGVFIYNALKKKGYEFASRAFSPGVPQIKFTLLTPTGINANILLPVTNNTDLPLPVQSAEISLFYGNDFLGNTRLIEPVTIQARETTNIKLNLFISFAGLSASIIELIQSRQVGQLYASGTVTAGGVKIPFTYNVTF